MAKRTRQISFVNNRGGVAKSTSASNVAVGLAMKGARVLLIDADASGGATVALGLAEEAELDTGLYTTADFMSGATFAPIKNCMLPGLDFLPATNRISFLEAELYVAGTSGNKRLAESLSRIPNDYDYILVDSPPHLGAIMANVVIAAPEILIPVKMDLGSVPQTLKLHDYVKGLKTTLQPRLSILGVLPTFFVERDTTPKELLSQMKELFGAKMFDTMIHQSRAVANAFGVGRPILLANPNNRGAEEYRSLVEEIISRG
ncbi:ParA family protein (plasmid) [Myxococcus stipitatus]|uniref:ParA family protein n=1 Tax=Myxococcus stipitatus TaxID=83455 RepID=UPI003144DF51